MGNRVYVGNLSYSVTTQDLKDAFAKAGTVTDAKVMDDRESGQSRGFGFVTFSSDAQAAEAIQSMNGFDLMGRKLVVNEARERTSGGPPRGGPSAGGPPPGGGYGEQRMGGNGGGRDRGRRGDRDDRY